jgi:hypothetical protein
MVLIVWTLYSIGEATAGAFRRMAGREPQERQSPKKVWLLLAWAAWCVIVFMAIGR